MSIEKLNPTFVHVDDPDFAKKLSWHDYEKWAISELIAPNDRRYARRKLIEETDELIGEPDNSKVVDEAGDVIWSVVASRALAYQNSKIDQGTPFDATSFEGIVDSYDFSDLDDASLEVELKKMLYLYERKIRLAIVIGADVPSEARRDYITGVIDSLAPLLISTIAEFAKRRGGVNVSEILSRNVNKIEQRIAEHTLNKLMR